MFKRFGLTIAAIAASAILGGTAAVAVLTGSIGGPTIQVQNRAETTASFTNLAVFNNLPGAVISVTVPAGATRLVTARFTAESQCTGVAGRWCSVRVVVFTPSGGTVELNPQSGIDYAFDSASNDNFEGNALERSIRLPAGTYRVVVQRAVSVAGTGFRLDDWHFRVELNA
jgi:hypothetical protein